LRYSSTPPNTTRTSGCASIGQFSDSRDNNNDNEYFQENCSSMENLSPLLAFPTTIQEDVAAEYYSREEHKSPTNELETINRNSTENAVGDNNLYINNDIMDEVNLEEPIVNTTNREENSQNLATVMMVDESRKSIESSAVGDNNLYINNIILDEVIMEEPIINTTNSEQNSQELATAMMVDELKKSIDSSGIFVDVDYDEKNTKLLNGTIEHILKR
jgi:hypothetical protein